MYLAKETQDEPRRQDTYRLESQQVSVPRLELVLIVAAHQKSLNNLSSNANIAFTRLLFLSTRFLGEKYVRNKRIY
jgi:hypothetical protein